ncbi:hypothetical protein M2444_005648 [Paenibacillus sp. PastF-3]|uniref:hypothetical protein n=1 Tax=Paenibacillus sp. PastF-3 TaxID=2940626 RepID=UPI002476678B|nr:hypothetical protein [Paenibacillus sp. PastF-3]MDH6373805.1 hypothetical protein [Paenibacillus sp. PastF-3]
MRMNKHTKNIIITSVVTLIVVAVTQSVVDQHYFKKTMKLQNAMFTTTLNNYHILEFREMIVDYANGDLSKEYVQIRINKIVDPLYSDQDTKELAFLMEKASGIIEDGTTEDLKAFTSNDFSAALASYAEKSNIDLKKLFPF